MDATLHQPSPVDYELEVTVPHAELAAREKTALKRQASQMNLKGFRPGRVPASMVKKMYGEAIAAQIAEQVVSEAFRAEVLEKEGGPEPLGQPRLTEMDYALGGDLKARIRFGVRPEVEIADLSDVEVSRLTREITDEDVEKEAERQLRKKAVLVDAEEPISEASVATIDMQEVDAAGVPIIGQRQDDIEVELDDERLRDDLREALLGKAAGDTFNVELKHEHGPGEGEDHDDHVDRYQVTVKTVKHRQLPELDDELVKVMTNGRLDAVPVWKAELRSEMERAFQRISGEMTQEQMIRAMLERHTFPVPEALTEQALDEMEQEAAKRQGGQLPAGFDREGFRAEQREAAEGQIRWMLLKDQLIEEEGIELTDEDYEREFNKLAENGPAGAEQIKAYFTQQPQLLQNLERRLLNDRLFEALEKRFKVVEKTTEEAAAESEAAEAK